MSAQDVARQLQDYLNDGSNVNFVWADNNLFVMGTDSDATLGWDGTDLKLLPAVDDSTFRIGNGTLSWDVFIFGSATASYISWDASANRFKLEDNVQLHFGTNTAGPGTAGDASMQWDATILSLLPTVDDSIYKIGNGTLSFDVWIYGNTVNTYVSWDASADRMKFEDSTGLQFGTGGGAGPGNAGDLQLRWDGTDFDVLALADDQVFNFGNGTQSWDVITYGNTANAYLEWDASLDQLGLRGPSRPRGFNALPRRYELKWVAGVQGKPGLNADIQDVLESVRMIADPAFEILGLNCVSTCSAHYVEGGITLTTTTGSGDQVILAPHLDTSETCWAQTTWGTDQETVWECHIGIVASSSVTIWAGLKLTNTSVTTTDNDQVFFRYQNGVNSGKWQAIQSIANVDTSTDSGITIGIQSYHLKIIIDSSRVAKMYIDGVLVATSTALTNAVDLIPYIGVETGTTAAKSIRVYGQSIARNFT